MLSRLRAVLGSIAEQIPTVLVLLALLALGWWGALHDWKLNAMLPWPASTTEPKKETEKEEPGNPLVSPKPVELPGDETANQAGFETVPATSQSVGRLIEAPAVLSFDQNRFGHVAARAGGLVWRVLKETGDPVTRGEVLALVAVPEVGKAKADLLASLVQFDLKNRLLQRYQAASGSIPERQIRDAEYAVREAKVALLNAQQALGNVGLTVSLDSLRNLSDDEINAKLLQLGLPDEIRKESNLPANLLPIVSPLNGIVVRRDIVVGEMAGPSQHSFSLADLSRLWVTMDVRLEDVGQISVGQAVTFEAGSTRQVVDGTLKWISTEVEPKTRTVKARAEVYNLGGNGSSNTVTPLLRPGTYGRAKIKIGRQQAAIMVPQHAIQWDGQSKRVFVQKDPKTFAVRLVLIGSSSGTNSELMDPRLLLVSLLPQTATGLSHPLFVATAARVGEELLKPVRVGDRITTIGSHVLKSEMLKSQIGGED